MISQELDQNVVASALTMSGSGRSKIEHFQLTSDDVGFIVLGF